MVLRDHAEGSHLVHEKVLREEVVYRESENHLRSSPHSEPNQTHLKNTCMRKRMRVRSMQRMEMENPVYVIRLSLANIVIGRSARAKEP